MQCQSCGAEVPEGALRCPGCYEWVGQGKPINQPPPTSSTPTPVHTSVDGVTLAAIVCAGLGLLLLLAAIVSPWVRNNGWVFLLGPSLGLAAMVLGIISLIRGRRASQPRGSLALALTSLILGTLLFLLGVLAFILVIVFASLMWPG